MATVQITVGAVGDAPISANISALGRDRTITYVGGSAADSVAFEVSADNTNWAPLPFKTYGASPAPIELSDSAPYIRARRLAGTGSAVCAMSAAAVDAPPITVHERYAAPAGTDATIVFYEERAPGGRTVTDVRLVASQGIATDATDKITVTVSKVIAGTPTTIATYQSQTTAMVAGSAIGLVLANVALPQGAILSAPVTHGGSGKTYDFQVQATIT